MESRFKVRTLLLGIKKKIDEEFFPLSKVRCKRIILASRSMEVNHAAKGDKANSLNSSLIVAGSFNSSMSNLDEFEWMKEETKSEWSSDLSIATFSATKELVKMTKEVVLDDSPWGEAVDFSFKQAIAVFSPWLWDERWFDSIESLEEEVFNTKEKEDFGIFIAEKPWVFLVPRFSLMD